MRYILQKTACIMIVVLICSLLFTGCRSNPVAMYDPGGNIKAPSLQMTAFAAKDVYIAEIVSVEESSHIASSGESSSYNAEMISFTAKINKVFKGDFIEGTTVIDETNAIYKDFITVGAKYVLCTGFGEADNESVKVNNEGAIFLYRSGKNATPSMVWGAENNVAAAVRINEDGSLSWFRDDVPWKPQNTEELYQQLYDGGALLSNINFDFSQNVTEIRCVVKTEYDSIVNLNTDGVLKLKQELLESTNIQPYNMESGITTSNVFSVTESDDIAKWKQSFYQYKAWIYGPHGYDKSECTIAFNDPEYETKNQKWNVILIFVDGEASQFFAYNEKENCLYDIENGYWSILDNTNAWENIFTGK